MATIRRRPTRTQRSDTGVAVLSKRAIALSYTHAADGRNYEHEFERGVTIEVMPDGSVRLSRPDGQPLWAEFNVV